MAQDARKQLLSLIDHKVFDPILQTSPDRYSGDKRAKLEDLQKTTRSTQERYHESYKSAKEVRDNYRSDLSSEAAESVQRESRELGLLTLDDIKGEFEQLVDRLGVGH